MLHKNGGHGLIYSNKQRELILYDKCAEMRSKREPIPDEFISRHVLRYEIRYNKRPTQQLSRESLYAGTLLDLKFYQELVKRWQQAYFAIERNRKLEIGNHVPLKNTKSLLALLAAVGVSSMGGMSEALAMVKDASQGQGVEKWQLQRYRNLIRELGNQPGLLAESDRIQELDRGINEIAESNSQV